MQKEKQEFFKLQYYKTKFFSFFIVLFSFIIGNLIGILLKNISYNIITLFLINLLIEFANYLCYSSFSSNSFNIKNFTIAGKQIIKLLNTFKRGFLLGIFVEAFKVGS
uniref:conserved protein Ycf20 n=1 Tax=Prototheca miyajii TaxID=2034260 RepID=UPI0030030236